MLLWLLLEDPTCVEGPISCKDRKLIENLLIHFLIHQTLKFCFKLCDLYLFSCSATVSASTIADIISVLFKPEPIPILDKISVDISRPAHNTIIEKVLKHFVEFLMPELS